MSAYKFQGLQSSEFYLLQDGKIAHTLNVNGDNVHVALRLNGGKGGFGSMLRAIGAQIEKTTNREACRDLSGRRLRDINEEKRLKTWLDGQKDREQEAEEKRKKKIEKLQTRPKHDFKDAEYEQSRSELTETVAASVAEGFRMAEVAAQAAATADTSPNEKSNNNKRKATNSDAKKLKKKKKNALWLGADISSSSDTESDSDTEAKAGSTKQTIAVA